MCPVRSVTYVSGHSDFVRQTTIFCDFARCMVAARWQAGCIPEWPLRTSAAEYDVAKNRSERTGIARYGMTHHYRSFLKDPPPTRATSFPYTSTSKLVRWTMTLCAHGWWPGPTRVRSRFELRFDLAAGYSTSLTRTQSLFGALRAGRALSCCASKFQARIH